jgi:hypothetical protein
MEKKIEITRDEAIRLYNLADVAMASYAVIIQALKQKIDLSIMEGKDKKEV